MVWDRIKQEVNGSGGSYREPFEASMAAEPNQTLMRLDSRFFILCNT